MTDRQIVVGSGPAGIAASYALLKQGKSVLMLDVGIDLEPESKAVVSRMAAKKPEQWEAEDVHKLRDGLVPNPSGVPVKLIYGSDYPYRPIDFFCKHDLEGVDVKSSFAKGGLSTVWGAALLPYLDQDLKDWPLSAADLAPHYEAVLDLVPATGSAQDPLSSVFPFYGKKAHSLQQSQQIQKLRSRLKQNEPLIGMNQNKFLPHAV